MCLFGVLRCKTFSDPERGDESDLTFPSSTPTARYTCTGILVGVPTETYSRHLIRIARRHAALTQQALAERAATSQAAISAYESGRRSPSVNTLCRILAAAGFEVRMRLAEPDSHEPARAIAESLLPSEQIDAHNSREERRIDSPPEHG